MKPRGLGLPDGEGNKKPVRLTMDVNMLNFELEPGPENSEIAIEGDYDQNNFELVRETVERDKYLDVRLTFRNKKSFWGMLFQNDLNQNDIKNRLRVTLPSDLLYELKLRAEMGQFDLDLAGLALSDLNLAHSMGEMTVSMGHANQVEMEKFRVRTTMGETKVYDLQNIRFEKGNFTGRMGSMKFYNSGDFERDMDIKMSMAMGEARLQIPDNVTLDSKTTVLVGESRKPRNRNPEKANKTLKLSGNVTLGEHRVTYGSSKKRQSRAEGYDLIRDMRKKGNTQDACEMLAKKYEANPDVYYVSKSKLNSLGYWLLEQDRIEDALDVFRLNVKLHPDYANGFDSLGEGYMIAGEVDLAIENYKKSLEMDPGNSNGLKMLKMLMKKKAERELQ